MSRTETRLAALEASGFYSPGCAVQRMAFG